jgi:hypothetical protein
MEGWDIFLLVVAGYAAAMALARMMIRRRNELVDELVHEAERAERTKAAEEAVAKQAQQKQKAA